MKIESAIGFEIEIQNGLIKRNSLPEGFIITDNNIFHLYKGLIGENGFVIKAGENSKILKTYSEIINSIENTNQVIAFGGGVVGDLAGFIASTYKRGVDLIYVPTSLLAMVDSSIGGKNGINLGERKNYLGTIYQPKKILIDPTFLETLPIKEFRNGVAEIIKYGIVFGEPSLQRLEKRITFSDFDLPQIISQCCLIKTEVVEEDEKDKGYRHTLNFGHTIGHALELLYNLSHGEAISIGMVKEFELGLMLGIIQGNNNLDQIKRILEVNGLPTNFPEYVDLNKVLNLIKQDKKGSFVFAFDKENYNVKVQEEDVRSILSQ